MQFSQKMGLKPIKTIIQIDSIDIDLKNRLWNTIVANFFGSLSEVKVGKGESQKGRTYKLIWTDFFVRDINKIGKYTSGNVITEDFERYVNSWFFRAEWFEIYDFIEFISLFTDSKFSEEINIVLQKEVSGYRVLNNRVIQITSEIEINEVEVALEFTNTWSSVNTHLKTALDFLSDRKKPDYRNSIKESISAVEALCVVILDDKASTLGKALAKVEKRYPIHGSLKNSFSALYGYTSDSSGIRHALIDGDNLPEFEDAKFMLVACSAFINYLKVKMDK